MGYVYRYRDNTDGIIKYVGIVYGKTRTLENRIKEHLINEEWCNANFTVEYITENINNRSEAEAFESHYISLYGTDKYYNKAKRGWGINKYLPDREKDFTVYLSTFNNSEIKILYEVYGFQVYQIYVYRDGDCYRCKNKKKDVFTEENLEKYDRGHFFYTFDKKKAYLLAKENAIRGKQESEDSYKRQMNMYNEALKDINVILEDIRLKEGF